MTQANVRLGRWMGMTALALALVACGGGGDDAGTPGGGGVQPGGPAGDARNGTYNLYAADGREYTLALDFDAKTYRVSGGTTDRSGAFAAVGDEFAFLPGNATGPAGFNTARFNVATDAIVGEFDFTQGAVPFLASRKHVSTIAGAVGVYNFLGRRVDASSDLGVDTSIQQGEITSDGNLRTCDNTAILRIQDCPDASVTTAPITLSGSVFTATVPGQGTFTFRVAQVGSDKVFERASPSSDGTRRFVLGTPATGDFAGATFEGGTTDPAWGTVTLTTTTFATSATTPAGATFTRSGTSTASNPGVPDIRIATATNAGQFFGARSSEIGIVVAARNNLAATGFVAVGRAQ